MSHNSESALGLSKPDTIIRVEQPHKTSERAHTFISPSRAKAYALAAQRMRRSKWLVLSGLGVSVAGIIVYCIICFSAAIASEPSSTFLAGPRWLAGSSLGIIGLGTLMWLVGSFDFVRAAMDSDPNGPDLHF